MTRVVLAFIAAALSARAADFTGLWFGTHDDIGGTRALILDLRQENGKLTGFMISSRGPFLFQEVTASGTSLVVGVTAADRSGSRFELTLDGDRMSGKVVLRGPSSSHEHPFRAYRAAREQAGFAGSWSCEAGGAAKRVLRIWTHREGAGGFAPRDNEADDVFSAGVLREGKLSFQLQFSGEKFELGLSGNLLKGVLQTPVRGAAEEKFTPSDISCARTAAPPAPKPGSPAGSWVGWMTLPRGDNPFGLILEQRNDGFAMRIPGATDPGAKVTVRGSQISIVFPTGQALDLKVDGNELSGKASDRSGASYPVRALRRE